MEGQLICLTVIQSPELTGASHVTMYGSVCMYKPLYVTEPHRTAEPATSPADEPT